MRYDQEYIYTLLLRKQLGDLSEVEDKLLQKVMETDEQVRNCWIEQEEARRYTFNAFLEDLRVEHDWCKIRAVLTPKPLHTRIYYFLKRYRAVAAMLVAAMLTAAVFVSTRQHKAPSAIAHFAPHKKVTRYHSFIAPVIIHPDEPIEEETAAVTDTAMPVVQVVARHIENDTIYQSSTIEWNTLTVPPQTDYHIELADGTEVHLNASSTLRFPFIFPGKTREVYLEGEAYFTVAHNPAQPFIVHTGTASVIALGTAFNVNSYDNKVMTTSLVQGTVITDVGDSLDVTLKPGYEAIYRPGEPFKVKRFDETVTLGWRDGMYRFVNKPLEDIGPVIMRWFGLKLDFSTPALSHHLFSANLDKDKPLSTFLNEISSESDIDYKVYDETIHFSIRKSGN
ncbi:FecR family protein [Chitinophaga sp. YR573]|uniref:FecR family protein n=1 Tax=Chitinophaga sp. YR573 TaxID=1881040 RepID=UPI0008AF34BF|nr:FecR family protein [Chitinophaga sp. YR573]SEW17945.1 FecR family protein [Chitinophaga sp. YR573]